MAFTQDDLDTINRAISTGEKRVSFSDRTIEYRDIHELLRARSEIEKELSKAVADGAVTRIWPMRYKGF